jgi:hypothetical protein
MIEFQPQQRATAKGGQNGQHRCEYHHHLHLDRLHHRNHRRRETGKTLNPLLTGPTWIA